MAAPALALAAPVRRFSLRSSRALPALPAGAQAAAGLPSRLLGCKARRLMRSVLLSFATLMVTAHATLAKATDLYAYVGNTPLKDVIPFENMLGRRLDGVVMFDDYRYTPEHALAILRSGLRVVPAQYKLAISIGLAFGRPSTGATHDGAHTLQDVAAGKLDGIYAAMGASLVAQGFPAADIRLGWEENGGWYGWAAHRDEAAFHSAFSRIYHVLHATPGSCFNVWFNPGVGLAPDRDIPSAHTYDGVAWDTYAAAALFATTEPALWNHALNARWGIRQEGVWPSLQTPLAVPEFGVGSASNGKGAPSAEGKRNGGDDGLYMFKALTYILAHKARFIGYWDVNAGDYNSRISDGLRPHEALAFLSVMGSPRIVALLRGATLSATKIGTPIGIHALVANLSGGAKALMLWGDDRRPHKFDLRLPTAFQVRLLRSHGARSLGHMAAIHGYVYAGGLDVVELQP